MRGGALVIGENASAFAAPLVTCAMPTLATSPRLPYVKSSVADYLRQRHPNTELLAIVNGPDAGERAALIRYLASLERPDIRILEIRETLTLGRLRNLSFEYARGEVVCQWDDDDRHHPDRVSMQLQALSDEVEAVYLQDVMQYFPRHLRLYLTRWAATEERAMAGTLMAWRKAPIRYPEEGPHAHLGEDSQVAFALNARGKARHISEMAHLYVYTNHGLNSWPDGHHQMLVDKLAISKGLLLRREAALREGLRAFNFDTYPVTVCGSNGPAFDIAAEGAE